MPNDKELILGNGEYEAALDGEAPPSVRDARNHFLDAVRGLAPEVMNDLGGEAFDCYRKTGLHFDEQAHQERLKDLNPYDRIRELARLRHIHQSNNPDWQDSFESGDIDYDEDLAALQRSLFEWSRRWGLDEAWCRQRAFNTLDWWCSYPDHYSQKQWNYEEPFDTVLFVGRGSPKFSFDFKSLYPRDESRSEVTKRITEEFERQLKAFLDEREALAEEAGMLPTPKKRGLIHFEWLVCFQVKKMSYEEIYAQYYPKEYAPAKSSNSLENLKKRISNPVKALAKLTKLSLRADGTAPGRRPRR